jgi:hypothetical protein
MLNITEVIIVSKAFYMSRIANKTLIDHGENHERNRRRSRQFLSWRLGKDIKSNNNWQPIQPLILDGMEFN